MKTAVRFPFAVCAVVLLSAVSIALAQQDSKPAAKSDAKAADAKKPRAPQRGRLPPYYSKVVDGQQRDKIYAIQMQHEPKITALKAELKSLQDKVDAEVAAVLTPDQQAVVKKLTEEAKAKRKHATSTSTTSTTDGEAEEEGEESEADEKADEGASKTTEKTGK